MAIPSRTGTSAATSSRSTWRSAALAYHVYIERPVDVSPAGRARLAAAIAARYKLPEAQVAKHLEHGRLRVKSNVDDATARRFKQDLEAMGAICSIVDAATGAPIALTSTPPPAPSGAPPAPSAPPPPAAPRYESALSAALTPGAASLPSSLGALETIADSSDALPKLALASLDGEEEGPAEPVGLSAAAPPPPPPLQLDVEPSRPAAKPVSASPRDAFAPSDAFAPPDAEEAPLELAVAPTPKRSKAPPPPDLRPPPPSPEPEPAPAVAPAAAGAAPAAPAASTSPAPARPAPPPLDPERAGRPLARFFAGKDRQRLVAGLALALLLGFLPAHFVALGQENSKYGAIKRRVIEAQGRVLTQEEWVALDDERKEALEELGRARGQVRVLTLLVWLACGGAVGFAWFRKLT